MTAIVRCSKSAKWANCAKRANAFNGRDSIHLLVEHHVDAVRLDVNGVFAHELQDVLDGGGVGQPPQPDAVPAAAGGQEGGGRQNRKWHHGGRGRGQGGD